MYNWAVNREVIGMQALKLSEMLRSHEGQWVAFDHKRTQILGFGESIDQALDLARQKSSEEPIVTFVSRLDLDYVG
jgi:hypothetical protein